ncbi:hypothetical protein AWH62_00775 [Maricaulis sp. W15]|uniref:Uncharacterized protein n=1 Tax=Maricaulis maris TaxID=74318 RepID=A0A495DL83_9PROT|nr:MULTISPECIES: hypothetical protein [Maricaulis]OLF81241.1 hypothetical protein AWH62_00775 [Maricaulis sp. W15]RKR03678.1 hypothetical protein C7435_0115 [Maricaulis maris]
MRIPFALWSGVIAVLAVAALAGREYLNFGVIEFAHVWPIALKVAGVWLVLVVIVGIVSGLRKATTPPPSELPDDVAREIRRHPEH